MNKDTTIKEYSEACLAQKFLKYTALINAARYNGIPNLTQDQVAGIVKEGMQKIEELKAEAKDRFVRPYQENHDDFNERIGFNDWISGWDKYFEQLSEKGHFREFGEDELIKLPKQFRMTIPDFTQEQIDNLIEAKYNKSRNEYLALLRKYRLENGGTINNPDETACDYTI